MVYTYREGTTIFGGIWYSLYKGSSLWYHITLGGGFGGGGASNEG